MNSKYAYKSLLPDDSQPDNMTLIDGVRLPDKVAAKCASDTKDFIKSIKPDKDHSYVHLISTGALEWYGPNKRGDSFNETGGIYKPSEPYCKEASEIELDGGLEKYHNPTFQANGKVYREHHSVVEDPSNKPLGEVVFATYNRPMHRGELVVKLSNEEWKDDIERISNGKPCYYSMGCLTPDDVCSVCGKRTNPNDSKNRCDHLKNHLLEYTDRGVQVHAITDHPIFYDISRVARPADKIAFSLGKVASDGRQPIAVPTRFVDNGMARRADRLGLLMKIAAEEKTMTEQEKVPVEDVSNEDKDTIRKLKGKDGGKVLIILRKHNTMLPPPAFLELLAGDGNVSHDALPLIGEHLDGIFNSLLKDGSLDGFINDGTYDGDADDKEIEDIILPLVKRYSFDDVPFQKRIIRITLTPGSKIAADRRMIVTPGADAMAAKLAREYARYQLSFLTEHPDRRTIRQALSGNHAFVMTNGWQ